ncbi:hypothetical protein [Luedemannella helvata]|uniref:Uncharacterized protein n=1 Tax=Luedemannella helvata TaxID=349315 RepID=A0ABP4W1F0_9ACTN
MTERNPELAAAFDFARRVRDPEFRKVIHDHGCQSDQDVVITVDNTPVAEVLDRVFTRCRPPALVAVHRPAAPLSFVFLAVEPIISEMNSANPPEGLGEDTSIGMLYDSMPSTNGTHFVLGHNRSYNVQPVSAETVSV